MKQQQANVFWASYADLMTALFIVMLTLFILSYRLFTERQSELQVMAAQYQKIREIETALSALEGEYFQFDSVNKRHELLVPIEFRPAQATILPEYHERLREAGKVLTNTIKNIETDQPVKYIVVIEGMAARYPAGDPRNTRSDVIAETYWLSYQRALALYQFWESQGVTFDKTIIEVVIAGSGFFGAGRYTGREEAKNKRFLIQVIPKVGVMN
jgi:outer membrane protein OmpA-like peptidoglycan-associated protein